MQGNRNPKPNVLECRVHDALLLVDRERGMTGWEIASKLHLPIALTRTTIDRLEVRGYIESRWQGELWPNGETFNEKNFVAEKQTLQFYRSTASSIQTLAARVQSEREG